MVKLEAFNHLLPDCRQRDLVQQYLLDHRKLVSAQTRGPDGAWQRRPKTQSSWPDGERRRSITFTELSDLQV